MILTPVSLLIGECRENQERGQGERETRDALSRFAPKCPQLTIFLLLPELPARVSRLPRTLHTGESLSLPRPREHRARSKLRRRVSSLGSRISGLGSRISRVSDLSGLGCSRRGSARVGASRRESARFSAPQRKSKPVEPPRSPPRARHTYSYAPDYSGPHGIFALDGEEYRVSSWSWRWPEVCKVLKGHRKFSRGSLLVKS